MDKNYLKELIFKRFNANIVKEALVLDIKSLKDRVEDWRDNWHVLVLAIELLVEWQKWR